MYTCIILWMKSMLCYAYRVPTRRFSRKMKWNHTSSLSVKGQQSTPHILSHPSSEVIKKKKTVGFPGGIAVKDPPWNAGDVMGSIPGPGTKISHASEQLSPQIATEPEGHNQRIWTMLHDARELPSASAAKDLTQPYQTKKKGATETKMLPLLSLLG